MTIKFRKWAGRDFKLTGAPDTFYHLITVLEECEDWNIEHGYESSAKWAKEARKLIYERLDETGYFDSHSKV